jgi:hypothetical protein
MLAREIGVAEAAGDLRGGDVIELKAVSAPEVATPAARVAAAASGVLEFTRRRRDGVVIITVD